MKCPSCGKTTDNDARFCKHCGTPLSGHKSATPPPVPPRRERSHESTYSSSNAKSSHGATLTSRQRSAPDTPPPLRKKGCGFGSVLIALILILGGGAAWFFTQQFRLERAAFERIRHSNSVSEIEQYLATRMYMPDEHRRAAQARIAHLQSDSVDFANATTIEACEHYLTIHPDGKYASEVQSRLNHLRKNRPTPSAPTALLDQPSTTPSAASATDTSEASSASASSPVQPTSNARYHVVAASFANYDSATMRAAELRGKGYSAYVMEAMSDAGRVYRVVVASYADPQMAQRTVQALRNDCPGAWVMTK
ncbi:MAG: SPOR domain-containing protein [Bacteroidaceae bacterium]|nr:SPOR domain-containing protein [Bacteroidaceae bacterium]